MNASPGFASLGNAIQAICNLVDNDGDNREIVAAILRDPALTTKLISIANSSRYPRGAGNVSTIGQVLAILGLNTVKSVALSLALLNSMSSKPQSEQIHAEIVAGFFSGALAAEITRNFGSSYSIQEAQVSGLMQNLGRVMTIYYCYEGIEASRKLKIEKNLDEADAIKQVLGVNFEEIGVAIARHWGLPDLLQKCLLPDTLALPPSQPASHAQAWHQLCALFVRRMSEILFRTPENREKIEVQNCINFFQRALRLNGKDTLELIDKCLAETDGLLAEMAFPCSLENARNLLRKAAERSMDILSGQDSLVKEARGTGQAPIDQVKLLMRQIHSHCGFDCTLVCLPSGNGLVAIAGIGRNAGHLTTQFRGSGMKNDIFQIIKQEKVDTVIPDVTLPAYIPLIPDWYNQVIGARTLVMLPLVNKERLLGVIYGDYLMQRNSDLSEFSDEAMMKWRTELTSVLEAGPRSKA